MSIPNTTPGLPTQGPSPLLEIHAHFIKDLSFENPQPFLYLRNPDTNASTSVNVEVLAQKIQDGLFEVTLKVRGHTQSCPQEEERQQDPQTIYLIEIEYTGIFSPLHIPKEYMNFFLFVEAPRILFPFVRALIARLTQESGFPPLFLKPIDFVGLLNQQIQDINPTAMT